MSFTPAWGYRGPLPTESLPAAWGGLFIRSMAHVALLEGGDVDNPDDPGGRTRWGITQHTWAAWLRSKGFPQRPVDTMSAVEAASIYRERYWFHGHCPDLPWPASLCHFDAMVQHGPGGRGSGGAVGAIHLLQRALGETDDGIVGPRTISALREAQPGATPHLLWERSLHYWRILDNRPTLRTFSNGWRNRVVSLRKLALSEMPQVSLRPPLIRRPEVRDLTLGSDVRSLPIPLDARRELSRIA